MNTTTQPSTQPSTTNTATTNPVNQYHNELMQRLSNDALLQGFRSRRRWSKSGW